jgi:NADPH:quinone reductase-like Zn-dependent oxidoreductase
LKAVRIHTHGGVEQLRYEDAPEPASPSPTEAIVQLHAAGVNIGDIQLREGRIGTIREFPHILGSDGAGIVVLAGNQVSNVKVGDAVCLYAVSGCGRCALCASDREFLCKEPRVLGEHVNGTYADYVRLPAKNCFPVPATLSLDQAAALPSVYTRAWHMLISDAELKPGESVLIRTGNNELTTAALQIAVQLRTRIFLPCQDSCLPLGKTIGGEYVTELGSDHFAAEIRKLTGKRGVDLVLDCIGGDGWALSLACLAKGGRLVTSGPSTGAHPTTDLRRIFWNHLRIFGSSYGSRDDLKEVLNFVEASRTIPPIDQVFALRDAARAHKRLEQQKTCGKIILHIEPAHMPTAVELN